jgi:hypothetical protein
MPPKEDKCGAHKEQPPPAVRADIRPNAPFFCCYWRSGHYF